MDEAIDPLALAHDRNLLPPHLIAYIALARVPGPGAIEKSVAKRHELYSRRRHRARFQLHISSSRALNSRRRGGDERDQFVGGARAGRVPERGALQEVATHARIAKRRKQVRVAFHSDLAITFRRRRHFSGRITLGQRGQLVDHSVRPKPPRAFFTATASSASPRWAPRQCTSTMRISGLARV